MPNLAFHFKQFTIRHDRCAMKVGTDGVLLGAWVNTNQTQRILDIGTGTGLVALMLAQRSNAQMDAIDIDEDASIQAKENIAASPFAGQIKVYKESLLSFSRKNGRCYDLIVSNPPYFNNALKSPEQKRSLARHADTLSLESLISDSKTILAPGGRIALILPADQEKQLTEIAQNNLLHIIRQTNVIPTIGGKKKRILVELSTLSKPDVSQQDLTIEIARHIYTPEYIALTREYYLHM